MGDAVRGVVIHTDGSYEITQITPRDYLTPEYASVAILWHTNIPELDTNPLATQLWWTLNRSAAPRQLHGPVIVTGKEVATHAPVPDRVIELLRGIYGQGLQ